MQQFDLYKDIAERTGGDIYIGVVGPVRTGKSTFIKKFAELALIANIEDEHRRKRVTDELPQSADGKAVMTTQPKFVPDGGETIDLGDGKKANVRLIDCVGYMIPSAASADGDGKTRMVDTPWSEEKMPFDEAAETGTRKVIRDHSTIGILVTSDGSVTDAPRAEYVDAERRVAAELAAIGKPYVIVLNTRHERDAETKKLAEAMRGVYNVPVIVQNVAHMDRDALVAIIECVLGAFPIESVGAKLPDWLRALPADDPIIADITARVAGYAAKANVMADYGVFSSMFDDSGDIEKLSGIEADYAKGRIVLDVCPKKDLFYRVLSRQCGVDIGDEFKLVGAIREMSEAKRRYDKLSAAIEDADNYGYGVTAPELEDMEFERPEIVHKGSRFGIKMRASAPSYHILKVDVETEVNPILGTEAQDEDMVKDWLDTFGDDTEGIWQTNMLGKSLNVLARDGLTGKLSSMPEEARAKLRKTVTRIVNEGRGGVLCILL